MQIKHYSMTPDTLDYKLLKKLDNNNLYTLTGILRDVYRYPMLYVKDQAYISLVTYRNKPVTVMFLSKGEYFGWDYDGMNHVAKTYGTLAFYTHPDFRGRHYSRTLFEDFDSLYKIRKLSASNKCKSILRSLDEQDVVFIKGV